MCRYHTVFCGVCRFKKQISKLVCPREHTCALIQTSQTNIESECKACKARVTREEEETRQHEETRAVIAWYFQQQQELDKRFQDDPLMGIGNVSRDDVLRDIDQAASAATSDTDIPDDHPRDVERAAYLAIIGNGSPDDNLPSPESFMGPENLVPLDALELYEDAVELIAPAGCPIRNALGVYEVAAELRCEDDMEDVVYDGGAPIFRMGRSR